MFKKKPEPKLKYRKKTVEVPKVKCELFFVGRNGELENYVESYVGRASYNKFGGFNKDTVEDVVFDITINSDLMRKPRLFLENNNRSMNMEYYTLAKVVIKDVKQVEIEIEEPYYEEE